MNRPQPDAYSGLDATLLALVLFAVMLPFVLALALANAIKGD